MDDLRERLADAVADERPRRDAPDLVREDLRNRRRRQRLAAGIVGVAVAAGVVSILIAGWSTDWGLDPDPSPRPADELEVPLLRPAWSADVADTSFMSAGNVGSDDRNIYVPTTRGAVAYPKACSNPCSPLWQLVMLDEPSEAPPGYEPAASIAVGDGVVAATLDGRLAVAATDCRSDGGVCSPLWIAESPRGSNGYREPILGDGVVRVYLTYGENDQVSIVGFRADCRGDGGECGPQWEADAGSGTTYSPSAFVNGVFYQQVGTRMTGVAADCGTDGATCALDLVIPSDGTPTNQSIAIYGPVGGEGEVVFVTGTGSIRSYPEHCRTDCRPLWVGPVADYLESFPSSGGDIVMASDSSGVTAFPLGCRDDGGECDALWRAELGRFVWVTYADARYVVAAAHHRDPGIHVMRTDCPADCRPVWSATDLDDVNGVASDGRTVFVATPDAILGYPLECEDPCTPAWRGEISGTSWDLIVDATTLVAASQTGDDIEVGLRLSAFSVNDG